MGRIVRAAAMGFVRRCVGAWLALVYVASVCFFCLFLPLGRWGERLRPDPRELIAPVALSVLFLLVGPALLAGVLVKRRNARFDAIFTSLGLEGFPFALQFRRYDGSFLGRRLQAFVSRGPRIVLEADTRVPTRMGITADAGDTTLLAGLLGKRPIPLGPPAPGGLVVFGEEEAWVRRLFADPGVPTLLQRLLLFDGPFARRQLVLRPGALTLTFQLSTAPLRWIPTPEQARGWAEDLAELALIAERAPSPAVVMVPTPLEAGIGSVRAAGPSVNPGMVALTAILATPLLIGAVAGVTLLARRSSLPERGPGSRAEAFEVLGAVHRTALDLQRTERRACDLATALGTLEREDDQAARATVPSPPGTRLVVSKAPGSSTGREVEWLFSAAPAIRVGDLSGFWGEPSIAPAPDEPAAVVALFDPKPAQDARWKVRIRARFQGGARGPLTRLAVIRGPAR